MKYDVVVIGLGAAGLWATREALETSRDLKVLVVDRRVGYDTYSPCALPFALTGEVSLEELKHTRPPLPRLKKMMGYEVRRVEPDGRRIYVAGEGGEEVIEYGSCVVATGSSPSLPPIRNLKEALGRGACTFSRPEDAEEVVRRVKSGVKRAVVVGCGVIGMEVSHALKKMGVEVLCVDVLPYPMQETLDEDMVRVLINHLEREGVEIMLGVGVEEIILDGRVRGVVVGDEEIPCELVVVATGIRPNTQFLEGSGVKLKDGHIVVDREMKTSVDGIYAAGDAVIAPFPLPPGMRPTALASTAYIQGKVAGRNAAQEALGRGERTRLKPSSPIFAAKIGELEVAATGLNLKSARERYEGAFAVKVRGRSLPDYFPGGAEMTMKLIVGGDGRLLGGQMIGGRGTFWRMNLVGWAVSEGVSVEELSLKEMAYTPPLSDMYDILAHAADRARAKLKRRERG